MGGKVAMLTACEYPDLVEKLIVADISPREYEPHHQEIMQALKVVDFSRISSRKEVENIMRLNIKEYGVLQFMMKKIHLITSEQFGFRFNLNDYNQDDTVI